MNLLNLPKGIRQAILRQTGLTREKTIDLARAGYLFSPSPTLWLDLAWNFDNDSQRLPKPVSLLFTCKQLHAEVLELTFGENKYRLSTMTSCLTYLRRLPAAAWQHFKNLEFVCVDAIFADKTRDFEETAHLWNELCSFVAAASKHRSEKLTISFVLESCLNVTEICRLMDMTLPLRPLAEVRIAANCEYHQPLPTNSAHSLAWYGHTLVTTRTAEARGSFPYLKLPAELRLLVLYHAGLVFDETKPRGLFLPTFGRTIDCCGECCDQETEEHSAVNDCYCSRGKTEGGYTLSYSQTCTCHLPGSSAIFAVKECRKDAIQTYYMHNKFFITGNLYSLQRNIESVPPDRLQYIKKLSLTVYNEPGLGHDIIFMSYDGGNQYLLEANEDRWTKIERLIRCLGYRFLHSNFALEINMHIGADSPNPTYLAVKRNLTTVSERFWALLQGSRLNRVVVNLARFDYFHPRDVTKINVLDYVRKRKFSGK